MTVRVERTFELSMPPERVWEFISRPENRAESISVVADYVVDDPEARRVTWNVELPIPLVSRTIAIETEDVTRRPPTFVEFVGRSRVLDVSGEHEIETTAGGCRLRNRFVVDGHVPGVERFFRRNLDGELENLRRALERAAG